MLCFTVDIVLFGFYAVRSFENLYSVHMSVKILNTNPTNRAPLGRVVKNLGLKTLTLRFVGQKTIRQDLSFMMFII